MVGRRLRRAFSGLFSFALCKLLNNKIHYLLVGTGLLAAAGLAAGVPIYLNGSLQYLLSRDLQEYGRDHGTFPGSYLVVLHQDDRELRETLGEVRSSSGEEPRAAQLYEERRRIRQELDRYARERIPRRIRLPALAGVFNHSIGTQELRLGPPDPDGAGKPLSADAALYAEIQSLGGIEEHVSLTDGRLPGKRAEAGVYEALVSEGALANLGIVIDQELTLVLGDGKAPPVILKPVGVFRASDASDPYWSFFRPDDFDQSLLVGEEDLLGRLGSGTQTMVETSAWYHAFDYEALTINAVQSVAAGHRAVQRDLKRIAGDVHFVCPFIDVMESYVSRSKRLINLIWAVNLPVLFVLGLFSVMTAAAIVAKDEREILLLENRGFTRTFIVGGYMASHGLIAAAAVAVGPFLGLLLARVLGAADGFLRFVDRKPLPVSLSVDAYLYAAAAALLFLLAVFFTALLTCRYVASEEHRRRHEHVHGSWWERIFLDLLLLAVSGYGFYSLYGRLQAAGSLVSRDLALPPDPLLLALPVLFILAACLLFLRLFPWLLELAMRAGRRSWKPVVYVSLLQVSRGWRSYHIVNVLVVFVLSVGLFDAGAARTLNANGADRIYYRTGCDVVLDLATSGTAEDYAGGAAAGAGPEALASYESGYAELPFVEISGLAGVEQAARVLKRRDVRVTALGKGIAHVELMAMEPYDFGRTVWYRGGLLSHHINAYLNLLIREPGSCIVSRSLLEAADVELGDHIWVQWEDLEAVSLVVGGVVDLWPSWDPRPGARDEADPMLVVADLSYIRDFLPVSRYEIWLKLEPGYGAPALYESLVEEGIVLARFSSAQGDATRFKRDPKQLALNGFLTIAFFILCGISFLCFLIFWYLHLKRRLIRFGVLRALGMSRSRLLATVVLELFLVSGAAMAAARPAP